MKSPTRQKNAGKQISHERYNACSKVVRDMMSIIKQNGYSIRAIAEMSGTSASTICGYATKSPRLDIVEACINAMGYELKIVPYEDNRLPALSLCPQDITSAKAHRRIEREKTN